MQQNAIRPTMVIDRRIGAFLIDLVIIGLVSLIGFAAVVDVDFIETESLDLAEQECDEHSAAGRDGFCLPGETGSVVFATSRVLSPIILHAALWLLRGAIEGMTGWTPGKLMMGIRVVTAGGSKIGSVKGLVRTMLLPIDGFPWGAPMLVGLLVASNNARQQRLGDIAAESFVVHKAAVGQFVTQPVVLPTPLPANRVALATATTTSTTALRPTLQPGPVVFPTEPPVAGLQPPPPTGPARSVRRPGMNFDEALQAYVWVDAERTLVWDDATGIWRDHVG